MIKKSEWAQDIRRNVTGAFVVILAEKYTDRQLRLISPWTRILRSNEIHELMMTDEQGACPGKVVNSVAALGFFEVKTGGQIAAGQKVWIEGKAMGELVGFDETHMPNHMNIVLKAHRISTGIEMSMELGSKISFKDKVGERSS